MVTRHSGWLAVALSGAFCCGVARVEAKTLFVDCARSDNSGDGLTVETAKRTIQAAVDAAAANDTVKVLPGVYSEGLTDDPTDTGRSRVFIDKPISLVSTAGKARTTILGQRANKDSCTHYHSYGLGDDAIRCIYITTNAASDTATTRIEGFTIANGATMYDTKGTTAGGQLRRNMGGGVAVIANDNATGHSNAYIVDCCITNCVATRAGGGFSGTYVRTFFGWNKAVNNGGATRAARHLSCVFMANQASVVAYPGNVVNCTFCKNGNISIYDGAATVCNCLFDRNTTDDLGGSSRPLNSATTRDSWGDWAADRTNSCNIAAIVYPSPAPEVFGDWALIASPECIGQGNVNLLNAFPAEYRELDINGRPRFTDGKISIGAAEPFEPACAPFVIEGSYVSVVAPSGCKYPCANGDAFYSETWPVQYKIAANDTPECPAVRIRTKINGSETSTRHRHALDADGFTYFTPPNSFALTNSVFIEASASVKYVDVNTGSDEDGDGSEDKPFKSISRAAGSTAYGTIYVRPGVYAPTNQCVNSLLGMNSTVALSDGFLNIVATGSPDETIIEGAPDPEAALDSGTYGCGSNAVRCLASSINCVMRGFTFRNGYTMAGTDGAEQRSGAAAYSSGALVLVDCVISNCVGALYGAAYGVTLDRCRVSNVRVLQTDDGKVHGVFANAIIANSLLCDSRGARMLAANCTLYNTTVWNTLNAPFEGGSTQRFYNSLLTADGDAAIVPPAAVAIGSSAGSILWGFSYDVAGHHWANPYFRDAAAGDFSVARGGEATTYGTYRDDYWYVFARSDLNNRPYAEAWTNGFAYAGAVQKSYRCILASSSGASDGTDIGAISPSGSVVVETGDTITFTASEKDTRNFAYFLVNGERVDAPNGTYDFVVPEDDAQMMTIKAVYCTDWYVDDDGDDGNTGADAAHPKKTLEAALTYAIAGDTVHLAEGIYREGSMIQSTPVKAGVTPYIRARGVVPAYVTLVGAGADKTFVCGQDATVSPDAYGRGSDAMRGLFVEANGTVSNLTVCAGRSDCQNIEDDNNHGAGILARSYLATVSDCVISNNVAPRAGGVRYGTYRHCRFFENTVTVNGSAGRDAYLYECYFDRNRGNYVLNYALLVYGCTFAEGNTSDNGGAATAMGGVATTTIRNTIFAGKSGVDKATAAAVITYANCVFRSEAKAKYNMSPASANCVTGTAATLVFDASGVPVVGSNVAIDAGELAFRKSYMGANDAVDLAGNPRVANGALDIGCFEADWKAAYAKHFYKRNVTVTAAPADAVKSGSTLFLPNGEIDAIWETARNATFEIPVEVTGAGTLTVTLDGAPLAAFEKADGAQTLRLTLTVGEHALVFAYAADATDAANSLGAVIRPGRSGDGTLFIFR